jgi:hypothetical protein
MRRIAYSPDVFISPPSAVGAAYLVTRFELFLRILSGVLEFDGKWKNESLRTRYNQQYQQLLPKGEKKFPKRINDVAGVMF